MSIFATATGVGSWPGTTARQAAEIVVGELHTLSHLVELPARGIGADLIGRAGALLVDIGIDTVPRGYRIAPGRSSALRRAVSLLGEDLDALEEAWEKAGLRGSGRPVKLQAPGPVTLAAHLELPGDTGPSPIPVRFGTSGRRWPRASRHTAPRWPGAWRRPWWCSSTNRRCPRRCRAACPA